MHRTIDVVGSRCGKGSKLDTVPTHLHVIDNRRTWLSLRLGLTILPAPIGKNVQSGAVVDEQELRAFGNGHRRLVEIARVHMHGGHAVSVGRPCRRRWLRDSTDE